jgi:hypothetical protein
VFNVRDYHLTNWNSFAAGEDSFDASSIGEAAEVVQEVVCDDELILIKG